MDIYHIWASLKAGVKNTDFSDAVHSYLGHLKAESFHHAVNSKVEDVFFALYRDFPDDNRVRGEEKF